MSAPGSAARRLLPLPHVALILGLVAAVAPPRALAQDSKTSSVDLVQVQLVVPSKVKIGETFLVLDELENQGEHPSANSLTGFCLSEDDVCDERDLRVGARCVPPLAPLTAHRHKLSLQTRRNQRCQLQSLSENGHGRSSPASSFRNFSVRSWRISIDN